MCTPCFPLFVFSSITFPPFHDDDKDTRQLLGEMVVVIGRYRTTTSNCVFLKDSDSGHRGTFLRNSRNIILSLCSSFGYFVVVVVVVAGVKKWWVA